MVEELGQRGVNLGAILVRRLFERWGGGLGLDQPGGGRRVNPRQVGDVDGETLVRPLTMGDDRNDRSRSCIENRSATVAVLDLLQRARPFAQVAILSRNVSFGDMGTTEAGTEGARERAANRLVAVGLKNQIGRAAGC